MLTRSLRTGQPRVRASRQELAQRRQELNDLPQCPITAAEWERAAEVSELLARAGRHRDAKPADLIIAAAAEAAGLRILHYDQDYAAIAAITRQSTRRICERGVSDVSVASTVASTTT